MIDKRPLLIAACATPTDVRAAIDRDRTDNFAPTFATKVKHESYPHLANTTPNGKWLLNRLSVTVWQDAGASIALWVLGRDRFHHRTRALEREAALAWHGSGAEQPAPAPVAHRHGVR